MEVYLQSIAMFRFIKLVRWSAFMLKSYRYFEFHFPQTNIFPSAIGALRCILYPRNDQRSRNLLHSSIQPVYLSKIGTVLPQFDQIWSPKPDPLSSSNNKSIPVTQIKLKTIPELARFSYQTESSIILLKSAQLFTSLHLNHILTFFPENSIETANRLMYLEQYSKLKYLLIINIFPVPTMLSPFYISMATS